MFIALSGLAFGGDCHIFPQGVTLGWHVHPLRGKGALEEPNVFIPTLCARMFIALSGLAFGGDCHIFPQGVTLGWYV